MGSEWEVMDKAIYWSMRHQHSIVIICEEKNFRGKELIRQMFLPLKFDYEV